MIPLDRRLDRLKGAAQAADTVRTDGSGKVVLFFSCTDGSRRAIVRTAAARTFDAAWTLGVCLIREVIRGNPHMARWLRIDWVDAARSITWRALGDQLSFVKRNYFRLGLSLDSGFAHAFLETELNANAMLYMGTAQAGAGINADNFSRYAKARHGLDRVDFSPDARVWLFTTRALFAGEDGTVHRIDGAGPNAGVREQGDFTPDDILGMVRSGSAYLASQVAEDGRFHYGWHPCFDRKIDTYNSLRHASSLFAMIEAWEAAPDDALRDAIERSIGCLVDRFIKRMKLEDGQDAAWLIDEGDEIKLGGLAACVLALTKYAEVFDARRYERLLNALGAAILSMQDPASGRFDHVLSYPSLRLKQRFRIVYYDGEAAFALVRLYRATGDQRWLDAAARALDHFIAEERWRTHDHWLAYCVDEMTQLRPLERYFRLGLQNVADYVDFIQHRITAFPTLLELSCATERVIRRLQRQPDLRHLLDTFDIERFRDAMRARARYLANGHFWPELAMFYARPERIVGAFFIRHHAFRVRIDDVEHFLSGLIAYRNLCLRPVEAAPEPQSGAGQWSARRIAQATGGTWVKAPPAGWSASGLSIFAPSFRPGDMIVARGEGKFGIAAAQEAALPSLPAAVIADDARGRGGDSPLLQVADLAKAVLDMGHFARSRFTGFVIGVTGSAGKTTTGAMLAHALQPLGVAQTRFNANLPAGIAWNLASIDWATPHIVLEMAIGRMRQNTQLVRPDIAVFTNILPAHLKYHRDTSTVAERKSRIFEGMCTGGVAILNREMLHWDEIRLAARVQGLKVLTYGESDDADVRLVFYDQRSRQVSARLGGRTVDYALSAPGRHMAINSLAVLGVAIALGHDVEAILPQLADFVPLAGRGDVHALEIDGIRLTILNDAYNANPGSMAASLELFGKMPAGGRKIAILGEMLELGDNAPHYHAQLAPLIERNGIDRVHVLGDLYRRCWDRLAEPRRGTFARSLDELKANLKAELRNDDLLMIKGSHGSGLHTLLGWLRNASETVARECY